MTLPTQRSRNGHHQSRPERHLPSAGHPGWNIQVTSRDFNTFYVSQRLPSTCSSVHPSQVEDRQFSQLSSK